MFVLSSVSEGVPLAVLEAMASGLPVAATRVGGVTDLIPEARLGTIVPPDEPIALADAILAALSRSAADLAAARAFVLERYDMRLLAVQTGALYRELLANG